MVPQALRVSGAKGPRLRYFALPWIALALLWCGLAAQIGWNANWAYNRALTNMTPFVPTNTDGSGAVLYNFPLLVKFSNDTALAAGMALGDAGDLTFVGEDFSQLFHEIEYWDPATGTLVAWVCVPALSNAATIYMNWGNVTGTLSFQGSNTWTNYTNTAMTSLRDSRISKKVWDTNYLFVYHFNETSSALPPQDSTAYGKNVTSANIDTSLITPGAWGAIGPAYTFVAQNKKPEVLKIPYTTTGLWSNRYYNASLMFQLADAPWNIIPASQTANQNIYLFSVFNSSTASGFVFRWNSNATFGGGAFGGPTFGSGSLANMVSWTSLQYESGKTATASNAYLYTNGRPAFVAEYPNGGTVASLPTSGNFSIGGVNTSSTPYPWTFGGVLDEFRFSAGARGTNWLLTEASNWVFWANGGFFTCGPDAVTMRAYVSNDTFPRPATNQPQRFFLYNIALQSRGAANWISNAQFIVSNLAAPADRFSNNLAVTTNMVQDTNYALSFTLSNAGLYAAVAVVQDVLGTAYTNTVLFTNGVRSNAYDLRNSLVYVSNGGYVVDLFRQSDLGRADPDAVLLTVDGSNRALPTDGRGRYFDSNTYYYGDAHAYTTVLLYSNAGTLHWAFTNATNVTAVRPASIQQILTSTNGAAGQTIQSLNFRATVPTTALSGDVLYSLDAPANPAVPSSGSIGFAYYEIILSNRTAAVGALADPVQLELRLPTTGLSVAVPNLDPAQWPGTANANNQLRLAVFTGGAWIPLTTSGSLQNGAWVLTAKTTQLGRYGLAWSGNPLLLLGADATSIRSRLMVAGQAPASFQFLNPSGKNVSVRISTLDGKTVAYQTGLSGVSWTWDGTAPDGALVRPGVYLYQIRIDNELPKNGSFMVKWP